MRLGVFRFLLRRLAVLILFCCGTAAFAQKPGMIRLTDPKTKKPIPYGGSFNKAPLYVPAFWKPKKDEFRGIWVTTQHNIDFPAAKSAAEFRRNFLRVADNVRAAGFNALIFQIRPNNDAFYPSIWNPWSRFLSGTEGKPLDPAFDPLEFMIRESHRRGLEFHAWINPYRLAFTKHRSVAQFVRTLSPKNYAAMHPEWVLGIRDGERTMMILNPGEPAVRQFILVTIAEILEKYDVDAIHMDDYFYPYHPISDEDRATYRKYARKGQSLGDWRRANNDALVHGVSLLIRRHNKQKAKNVRFGVSPFGIWANSRRTGNDVSAVGGSPTRGYQGYFYLYADSRKWIREGWIDYVIPQLYWGFAHPLAPYAALVDWWRETVRGTNVDLYIGHGVYNIGATSDCQDPDELVNQLKYVSQFPEVRGSAFFSYRRFFIGLNPTMRQACRRVAERLWGRRIPGLSK